MDRRLHSANAGSMGSIPGQGTKIHMLSGVAKKKSGEVGWDGMTTSRECVREKQVCD